MKARDVMVAPVITVKPSSSVRELAQTLLKNSYQRGSGRRRSGKAGRDRE